MPLRETQERMSENTQRDVPGCIGCAGQDDALHEEFAGVPATTTQRPAISVAERLGATFHSGSGPRQISFRG